MSTSSSTGEATVRFTSRDNSVRFLEDAQQECEGMNRTKPNDAKLIRHALKCCRQKERKTARNWWEQLDGAEAEAQLVAAPGEDHVPLKTWDRFKIAFVRLFPEKNKSRLIGKFQALKQTGPVPEFNVCTKQLQRMVDWYYSSMHKANNSKSDIILTASRLKLTSV